MSNNENLREGGENREMLLKKFANSEALKAFIVLLAFSMMYGANPSNVSAQSKPEAESAKLALLPGAIQLKKGQKTSLSVPRSGKTFQFLCEEECYLSQIQIKDKTAGIETAEIQPGGPNGFHLEIKLKKGTAKTQKITITTPSGEIIFNIYPSKPAKPAEPPAKEKDMKKAQEDIEALRIAVQNAATKNDLDNAVEKLEGYLTKSEFETFKQTVATAENLNSAKVELTNLLNALSNRVAEIENQLNEDSNNFIEINGQLLPEKGYGGSAKYGRTLIGSERFDLDAVLGFGITGEELPVKGFEGEKTHSMDYKAQIGLEQHIKAVKNWLSVVLGEEFVFGEQQRFSRPLPDEYHLKGGISPYVGGRFTGSLMTGFGSKKFQIGAGGGVELSNKRGEALGDRGNPDVKWVLEFLKARFRF